MTIFTSHASKDDLVVDRIDAKLREMGVETWVDHRSINGGDWNGAVVSALETCQAGLLVISANFLSSANCRGEWQRLFNDQKPVFIVSIDNSVSPAKLPPPLNTIQVTNLHTDFDAGIEKLSHAILGHVKPKGRSQSSKIAARKKRLKLVFDIDRADEETTKKIISFMANALEVGIEEIVIVNVEKGSLILTIELSAYLAEMLQEMLQENPDLLKAFNFQSIEALPDKSPSKNFSISSAHIPDSSSPQERSQTNKPYALVAGDPLGLQSVVRTVLEFAGYIVEVASDGEEALRRLSEKQFYLLCLNLSIPKMDGMTLLRTIRNTEARNAMYILVLIADRNMIRAEELTELADFFMLMPVGLYELSDLVKKLKGRVSAYSE